MLGVLLYSTQQVGIALAFGAQIVMLVAYALSMRDGIVDDKEAQFARAVQNTLFGGVLFILASGAGATLLHLASGQANIVFQPAYMFKWVLIIAALALGASWYKLPQGLIEGLSGGVWSALFMLHTLAPTMGWGQLLVLFVMWMVGFNIIWFGIVWGVAPHRKKMAAVAEPVKAPAQKQAPTPEPAPVPVVKRELPPPPPPPEPKPEPVKQAPPPPPPAPAPIIAAKPAPAPRAFVPPKPDHPMMPKPLSAAGNTLPLQKDPLAPIAATSATAAAQAPAAPQTPQPPRPGVVVMPKSPDQVK